MTLSPANKKTSIAMKRTDEDKKLGALLKQEAHQAPANEWFTPRVLNRLPRRSNAARMMVRAIYVVAFVVCAMCWVTMIGNQDFNAVTLRDLLRFAVMTVVTVALVVQSFITLLQHD